jgi:hypothetical protein
MRSICARAVLSLLLNLAVGALLSPIRAQTIPSPYRFVDSRQEAGVFLGTVRTGEGRFGFGPRSGMAVGARYGVDVSGPFGLEGGVTYLPTQRDLVDPRRAEGDRIRGEGDASLLLIDARLRFALTGRRTWNNLQPFVFAGAGGAIDLAGDPEEDELLREEDRFELGFSLLGSLGGGVRWMLGERFVLRGEAQLTLWQLDTPQGYLDTSLGFEAVQQVEWVNNGAFTVGLAYRF